MKRRLLLTICLCVMLCLVCGCSNSAPDKQDGTTKENETEGNTGSDSFVFELNGIEMSVHMKMEEIESELGEPDKYFESNSCAFQGLDKVYTYGGVVISTYPDNNVDYIYTIELKDDISETAEGICIGNDSQSVKDAYGEPASEIDTALTYEKGQGKLIFIIENDMVSSITYMAITE